MHMRTVKWTKINKYETFIMSETGEIVNTETWNTMKQIKHHDWYYVSIGGRKNRKVFKIAKLLAHRYLPNPENKECIYFKNWNPYDHRLENIWWATRVEVRRRINIFDKNAYSRDVWIIRKVVLQLWLDWVQVSKFPSTMAVERTLWFNYNKIWEACRGERKTYKWYIWKYEN